MSLGARLYAHFGYAVGVGQPWGRPMYGVIGYGIGVTPGHPLFHTGELSEFTEQVPTKVAGTWGSLVYAGWWVRQGHNSEPVARFSIGLGKAFSPDFVEDEALPLSILETETRAYEFSEVDWLT